MGGGNSPIFRVPVESLPIRTLLFGKVRFAFVGFVYDAAKILMRGILRCFPLTGRGNQIPLDPLLAK
jgi:hypothetical protein